MPVWSSLADSLDSRWMFLGWPATEGRPSLKDIKHSKRLLELAGKATRIQKSDQVKSDTPEPVRQSSNSPLEQTTQETPAKEPAKHIANTPGISSLLSTLSLKSSNNTMPPLVQTHLKCGNDSPVQIPQQPPITVVDTMMPVMATAQGNCHQVAPMSISTRMELVWHGEFQRLFGQFVPHSWSLWPAAGPPSNEWRVFKDSAKVRFCCKNCGHAWTSMKGRVIFWFHLLQANGTGCVMFRLYGQQCNKCKDGTFEPAMWYPEEVIKVVGNVYNRIGQVYYGFVRPPLRIDRRIGKPRNQHNADLCQACSEGICREEWAYN